MDLARVESSFQRRMVERDLAKTFATELVTTDADVVVLDLVDEQYDLVVGSDGGVATRSMEFLRAGGDGVRSRRVASGSPEFLVRWEAGWAALVATARRQGRLGRVVVHEAYWARGDAAGGAFDQQRVEAANRTLTYLYARMRKDLGEARFLRVPDRLVVGDPAHRWGPSPVHYVEDYRAFLDPPRRGDARRRLTQASRAKGQATPSRTTTPSLNATPLTRAPGVRAWRRRWTSRATRASGSTRTDPAGRPFAATTDSIRLAARPRSLCAGRPPALASTEIVATPSCTSTTRSVARTVGARRVASRSGAGRRFTWRGSATTSSASPRPDTDVTNEGACGP